MTHQEVLDAPLDFPVIDKKTGEELFIIGHSFDHNDGIMCRNNEGLVIWISPFRLEAVKNSGGKE